MIAPVYKYSLLEVQCINFLCFIYSTLNFHKYTKNYSTLLNIVIKNYIV